MNVRLAAVAVLALSLVVAGCGGGKKKSSSTTSTVTKTVTTAAGSTTGAKTTGSKSSSSTPGFASTKNCRQLGALGAKLSSALAASSGGGTPDLGDEAKAFKALAAAAPKEIRSDFETFAAAFTAYVQALAKAGYKPGQVPTADQVAALTQASKAFSAPKLQAAEQHLTAWAQSNCGIGTTTTTK